MDSETTKPTHPVDSKLHESVGFKPVDGELSKDIRNVLEGMFVAPSSNASGTTGSVHDSWMQYYEQRFMQVFDKYQDAHLQAVVREAEKNLLYDLYYATENNSLAEKQILKEIDLRSFTDHLLTPKEQE